MPKKAIIVYVDTEIYNRLKDIADKKGASISQVTREIIYGVLKNGETEGRINS